MSKPRKGHRAKVVEQLAALRRGGADAVKVAAELASADGHLQIRVSTARKLLYVEAAKRAGKTLSAWAIEQLDKAV